MTPVGTPTSLSTLCSMLFGIDKDSIYLSPAPLYHAAPLRFTMTTHRLGGTAIIMEHFDPEEYLRLVANHKVTHSTCANDVRQNVETRQKYSHQI